jgi:intracellular sulfur oxidation DsrE/DsrF family protein
MARRVVSVLHAPSGAPRPSEAALEANAFAVAEDIDLTLLLRGGGVEYAQRLPDLPLLDLAGHPLPDAAAGADLRGLLESGVAVVVGADCLDAVGLTPADLLDGVRVVAPAEVADLLRTADAVLTW